MKQFTHKFQVPTEEKTPLVSRNTYRTTPESDLAAARHFWRETTKDFRSMILMFRLFLGCLLAFLEKRTMSSHARVSWVIGFFDANEIKTVRLIFTHGNNQTPKTRSRQAAKTNHCKTLIFNVIRCK